MVTVSCVMSNWLGPWPKCFDSAAWHAVICPQYCFQNVGMAL